MGVLACRHGGQPLCERRWGNLSVRRIDARTLAITTFYQADAQVAAVTTDRAGNVYVGLNCCSQNAIVKLSPSGKLLQAWGRGYGFSNDGVLAASAHLCDPQRIALDSAGNILFGEDCSTRLRRINLATGLLDTVAGMGPHIIGETGPALETMLADPGTDLLFLPTGELLTAEGSNCLIRKMDLQGNVSVFAGSGMLGSVVNGRSALQSYIYPIGLARAPNGDILMVSGPGQALARIDGAGILTDVTGNSGWGGDGGPATKASLDEPYDVATDAAGNLFIADTNNNRIRRIDGATGIITTVAGSGGVNGTENYGAGSDCGDGGPATQACINTPYGVAVGPDGSLYIGQNAQRLRKVDPSGTITAFAPDAHVGTRLRFGTAGNLFTTRYRIEPNGHVFGFPFGSQLSGSGIGDGRPMAEARITDGPLSQGVAVDAEGNFYFSDLHNLRIRAVRFGAVLAEPGSTITASGGNAQTAISGRAFPAALEDHAHVLRRNAGERHPRRFRGTAGGASCTFPGGGPTYSALTDISGHISVACTANSIAGAYSVTATPLTLGSSATFSLTNARRPVQRRATGGD